MLGLFGEKDEFVNPSAARAVDVAIKSVGKQSEVHIYPGVGHAFFNDERPDAYNKAAADDAWKRTVDHFKKHLK